MKVKILLGLSAVFLVACSSKPLTEAECQQISEKEIQFAVSHVHADSAKSLREHLEKSVASGNEQCIAGKTYRRSDYRCMVKASDPESISECLADVNKRLGH